MSNITRAYSKTRAEIEQHKRDHALERARSTVLGSDHPIVDELVRWLAVRKSADTAATSMTAFVHFFGHCVREEIDPQVITRHEARVYAAGLDASGYSPTTSSTRIAVLRSFYLDAVEEGVVAINPFYKVSAGDSEPVTPTPSLTLEQCGQLAAVCRLAMASEKLVRKRDGAMGYVMMRVGPRRMEVAAAAWGNLTPAGNGLDWRIKGKGRRFDTTVIPSDGAMLIAEWRAALETAIGRKVRRDEPVFPSLGHFRPTDLPGRAIAGSLVPIGRKRVSNIFKDLLAQAGVEGHRYNAHAARATAATQAYAATHDLLAVQRMLRHRDQKTTAKYIRTSTSDTPATSWLPPVVPLYEPSTREDGGTEAA
jgi:integrase/recombinase XerC